MTSLVVLAGGLGKRLLPITKETPKPLLEVMGKKLYQYTLDYAAEAKLDEAIIVSRKGWITEREHNGIQLRIVSQENYGMDEAYRAFYNEYQNGIEDTLIIAFTGFIARPPNIIEQSLRQYTLLNESNMILVTPVATGTDTHASVEFDFGSRVKLVQEKGKGGSGYALAGVLIVNREGARVLYEDGIIPGLNHLASRGSLGAALWTGEWMDISYPWDILEAVAMLLDGVTETKIASTAKIAKTAIIDGPVVIDNNARLDEFAVVRGPTYIGRNVLVGMGAFVRPYSAIESSSIVGSRSELKRSVIMSNAEISSGAVIADSVVGPYSRIGEFSVAKSTYVDKLPSRFTIRIFFKKRKPKMGSIIGAKVKLGPHTVIPPGSIIE
ncbi:MAG: NTP transferase domain-containing protein [Desulfurococcales archaeon]|nr:NTP transferase domain-containing protein [Desulfurococcales archaeon]